MLVRLVQSLLPGESVRRQVLAGSGLERLIGPVAQSDVFLRLQHLDQGFGRLVVAKVRQGPGRRNAHVHRLLAIDVRPLGGRLADDSHQQLDGRRVPRLSQRR